MSGLDGIVAGVADDIVPGLQYSLATKRGAQYVKQRNSSTFYPNTSNTYSITSGQRTIRVLFSDAGSSMLDLSTVRMACVIRNNGANPLVFTGRHLACMFQRITTRVKGVQVDDVQFYNRLVGMLQSFKPANANYSDGVAQLGTGYDDQIIEGGFIHANGIRMLGPDVELIPGNSARRVVFDLPGISILNNHYLLPLGRYPLELTLEMVSDPRKVLAAGYMNPNDTVNTTVSTNFQLEEVEFKGDTLLLDSAVTNNIEEALVGGKPLSLHLRPWNVTLYNVAGTSTWSQIFNRAYSRLLSIFVNFTPKTVATAYDDLYTESNLFSSWHGDKGADNLSPDGWKPGNAPRYDFTRDEFRYQVQLGSQLYPNTAIRSHAESYYHLQKCVGELTSGVGVSTGPTYRSTNFHLATDFEKVASTPAGQADFSGQNTKMSGEQMRLFFEKVTPCVVTAGDADKQCDWSPSIMYICANYDQIVQLRLEGVVVAD